ncbi:Mobile element protein [Polaromonas sp. CG9_12]|nr:Mobile element protein [Polaromonas sp. CG9_12]
MHLRDKLSLHEIAKRTGLSRNTLRRWLRAPQEVQVPVYSRPQALGKLSAFTGELEQALQADGHRSKRDRRTAKALFAQIQAVGYVEREASVSSTCLVSVQRNRYSVPCEFAGQRVSTRLYPTRICVVAGGAVVASHERAVNRGQTVYDWQHYIALVQRKPGALRNGAPFADMPAPLKQLKLGLLRHCGGDRIMAQVLAAVPTAGLEAVLVAVELVIESGALSAEHVLNVLARLNACALPETVQTTLQLVDAPRANTGRYDSLRSLNEAPGGAAAVNHA